LLPFRWFKCNARYQFLALNFVYDLKLTSNIR
jgi:hypothetical protein